MEAGHNLLFRLVEVSRSGSGLVPGQCWVGQHSVVKFKMPGCRKIDTIRRLGITVVVLARCLKVWLVFRTIYASVERMGLTLACGISDLNALHGDLGE